MDEAEKYSILVLHKVNWPRRRGILEEGKCPCLQSIQQKKCLEVEAELPEDDISIIDDKGEDLGETKEDRIKEQNHVR